MDFKTKEKYRIEDLIRIMELLRGEGGCPWDREQTHQTIRQNLIEEAYEVIEAIDSDAPDLLCEELGDLLLQVIFHSRISEEAGEFSIEDVADGICKKLVLRHPHIFSDAKAESSAQVLDIWDDVKKKEKKQKTVSDTLHSVPRVFPALMRSQKVQKRAAKSGFDYPDVQMAFGDLKKETEEFSVALSEKDAACCREELGDILFSCVNVARMLDIDAEECLTQSCDKFIRRFDSVEKIANDRGIDMKSASLDRLNKLWAEVKSAQSKNKK